MVIFPHLLHSIFSHLTFRNQLYTPVTTVSWITSSRTKAPLPWITSMGNINNLHPTLLGLERAFGFLPKRRSWTWLHGCMWLPDKQCTISLIYPCPKFLMAPKKASAVSLFSDKPCFSPSPRSVDLPLASFPANYRN